MAADIDLIRIGAKIVGMVIDSFHCSVVPTHQYVQIDLGRESEVHEYECRSCVYEKPVPGSCFRSCFTGFRRRRAHKQRQGCRRRQGIRRGFRPAKGHGRR